ncbi:MAG: SDR family NAD(P)-dependent oxidoreductase [Pseudomonadota bacterium]
MHVVITGANRGIGLALFERYKASGDMVTGTSRTGQGHFRLDVTQPEDHRGLSEQINGNPVDLLICNAGVFPDKGQPLGDGYAPQIWADAFNTNVTGVFLSIQRLLPSLQRSNAPKIAIISSRMGSQFRAKGGSYAYRASKAAAVNLGRNLAVDLEPLGIALGIYHPGWVRTDMGGAEADISEAESADGLVKEFAQLSIETTGCFRSFDGEDVPL